MDKESKPTNDGLTCGMGGQVLLTQALPTVFGEGKGEGKRKTDFRERDSNFSLDFPVFGPSVLIRARGEVGLRCKGYA